MSKETWQEEFDKRFVKKQDILNNNPIIIGVEPPVEEVKQFISDIIDQTREETIKDILTELRLKLRNTYKAEDIADIAFLTESDLEIVLNK